VQIYISRNGRAGGPYSVDQVRRFLTDNTLFAEDSAWVGSNPGNVMPLGQLLQGHQPNDPPVLNEASKNSFEIDDLPPVLETGPQKGEVPAEITFPGEWMMIDSEVQLFLDDNPIMKFSFIKGVILNTDIAPGTHSVGTEVKLGPIKRTSKFPFKCHGTESKLSLVLEYSRMSGNFSKLHVTVF
jgi:hypothetical protein